MARTFAYDAQAAAEANSGGKRITEPGAYTGKFKYVWAEKNDKGTESVNFIFESDSGQEAGPLALYTHNGKGEELPSYKTLQAIIGVTRIKGIRPQSGTVKLWDYDTKAEVAKQKETYPALVGVPVGVILTTEDYENRNFEKKTRVVLQAAYTADTNQMPVELQSGGNGALQKYMDWLDKSGRWHKPLKSGAQPASQASHAETQYSDDDINF